MQPNVIKLQRRGLPFLRSRPAAGVQSRLATSMCFVALPLLSLLVCRLVSSVLCICTSMYSIQGHVQACICIHIHVRVHGRNNLSVLMHITCAPRAIAILVPKMARS